MVTPNCSPRLMSLTKRGCDTGGAHTLLGRGAQGAGADGREFRSRCSRSLFWSVWRAAACTPGSCVLCRVRGVLVPEEVRRQALGSLLSSLSLPGILDFRQYF